MAASMGMQVAGQIKQGRAAKRAGESQAEVAELQAKQAEYNAGIAETQADDSLARGLSSRARFAEQVRGLIGTQRSGYAAQGVKVDRGSAADVQTDATRLAEGDMREIQANAEREAWGFRVEATNYRKDAEVARKGGDIARRAGANAQTAAYLGAATSVVGATSSILLQRYGWQDKPRTPGGPVASSHRDYGTVAGMVPRAIPTGLEASPIGRPPRPLYSDALVGAPHA